MNRFIVSLTGVFFMVFSGCTDNDEFVASSKYIYSPVWKVWEIRQVDAGAPQNTILTRDINARYIFTDSITYVSNTEGKSYSNYTTNHLGLDSIVFTLITPEINDHRDYIFSTMYTMEDADPPTDQERTDRDHMFPELNGKFLFMRLEKKEKDTVNNRVMTEFLLLYN
jgi:hypothetical protein